MPGYEIGILALVVAVVAASGAIALYVIARAWFGGRNAFRPPPRNEPR